MKTILLLIALVVAYGIFKFVVSFVFVGVRTTLKRRKIAKLDRLDQMDNGNRLRTYFLEIKQIEDEIVGKWQGQFPRGAEGKLLKQLAWDGLMCIRQNPKVCLKGQEPKA
jgi:hypothetical protein